MKRKALQRGLLGIALLVAGDQVVQYTALSDGFFLGRRVAPFDPPLFSSAQLVRFDELQAAVQGDQVLRSASIHDTDLGWAPRPDLVRGATSYDWAGARLGFAPLAREKQAGVRRVVALGCSYTMGEEVGDQEHWTALLDRERADLEIANLAMGGYGLDQAYMRFVRDGRGLAPDEVWLGILPAALLRVTTHYPPLLSHWNQVLAFKPLFLLGEKGELVFRKNPARDLRETLHLLEDHAALAKAIGTSDMWFARAPLAYAPSGSSWTHRFASTRLVLTWLESRERAVAPYVAARDLPLYRLVRALILALDKSAEQVEAQMSILFLPSREDLAYVREHGEGYWKLLEDDLSTIGFRCLDLSETLLQAGALEDDSWWMPRSHYSPRTNQLVAETIAARW